MSDPILFFGRFHPLVLHLPIGLLAGAAFLETALLALRRLSRRTGSDAQQARPGLEAAIRVTLILAAGAACMAALLGLMLAARGDFSGDSFTWHKWLGIATAVGAGLAALLRPAQLGSSKIRAAAYGMTLAATLGLMSFAGHFGGVMVHGDKYLYQYAPAWIPSWVPAIGRPEEPKVEPGAAGSQYASIIRPLLNDHCVACHGPDKVNGNLRLDDMALAAKPGQSGQVAIKPGNPNGSEAIRRLLLPEKHAEFMPPAPEKALSAEQVLMLARWIESGAKTTADAHGSGPAPAQAAISQDAIAALAARGILIYPENDGSDNLIADFSRNRTLGDADLALLTPVAARVYDLNLSNTKVTDAGAAALPAMPRLRALRASRTGLSAKGAAAILGRAPEIAFVSLAGTPGDDALLTTLQKAPALREAALSGTALTEGGLRAFMSKRPAVRVTHEMLPLPDLSRPALALVSVNSEERNTGNYRATNLFDNNPGTIWHTQYKDSNIPPPYELVFENAHRAKVAGLTLLPRLDGANGTPKQFTLQASRDRKTWTTVAEGTLWTDYDKEPRTLMLAEPSPHVFFKLIIRSAHGGNYGSLAELRLFKAETDGAFKQAVK